MCCILHMIRMDQIGLGIADVPVTYLFVKDPFPPRSAQNALLVPSITTFLTVQNLVNSGQAPLRNASDQIWIRAVTADSTLVTPSSTGVSKKEEKFLCPALGPDVAQVKRSATFMGISSICVE
jgi:hypothetical protein